MITSRSTLVKVCDNLIARIVFIMFGGMCQKCRKYFEPEDGGCVHHFIRKGFGGGNLVARHTLLNCVWVCPGCHTSGNDSFHKMARSAELEWIKMNLPVSYIYVTGNAGTDSATVPTSFLDTRRQELQQTLDAVKRLKINGMIGLN